MPQRRETRNKEAFSNPNTSLNITNQFVQSLATTDPYDSIVDFATHPSFCGMKLYPRQKTLLKLIYLETENFTQYDLDVIEEWRNSFTGGKDSYGIQPDIWERISYLKQNGYRYFPHVQAVMGRRASKGLIGGILGAEKMAHLISLDNWQSHYGIAPGKDCYINVVATNSIQAKKNQFADIRATVQSCAYLEKYISSNNEYYVSLQSPADLRLLAELHAKRIPVDHEVASIRCMAQSSVSSSGRGSVSMMNFFDEFAWMLTGTEGPRSSESVYSAYQPSLDDFGKDSQTYLPSSPYCLEPSTKVLTEDLRWVSVGSLAIGDKLIGFDENHRGQGNGRTYQPAEVTETSVIQAPRYVITMESGKKITCTNEHMWLASWASQIYRYDWVKTKDLKPGDRIKTLGVDPWEVDSTRDGGYLAGFFDGEGYISQQGMMIGASQNYGFVLDKVLDLLNDRNFAIRNDYYNEKLCKFRITGGLPEVMRFLGSVRPERLLNKFPDLLHGRRIYGRNSPAVDRVVSVEYKDIGDVIALGTSTSTLIAEGLLSHNTKVGYFYDLYEAGCVLLPTYLDSSSNNSPLDLDEIRSTRNTHDFDLRDDDIENEENEILEADPEMLIIQLPSWELYKDWQRSPSLGGPVFSRAIQVYDDRMKRLERRNPTKFKVEKKAQFAEVEDAYLDPDKVDAMFEPFWDNRILAQSEFGTMAFVYEGHSDPSKVNANFAVAIAHLEKSPIPDIQLVEDVQGNITEKEVYWEHVIIDHLHVWKPSDYEDHTVDYVEITNYLNTLIAKYPAMKEFTFDAWNSAGPIAQLRQSFPRTPRIRVQEFNHKSNLQRAEYFKSAINLGWIHSYKDHFYGEQKLSLLEQELKFLTEVNGKVEKQSTGPVTTKDLADCHDDQTEVLTEHGWKLFKDVSPGEHVATRNSVGELEYQVPTDQVARHYQGEMYSYDGYRTNFCVTPGHRMLVQKRNKELTFVRAEDLSGQDYIYPKTTVVSDRPCGIVDVDVETHARVVVFAGQRTTPHQTWTIADDAIMRLHYATMPMDELLSALPGKTRGAVYHRANKVLGLSRGQIGDRQKDKPKALPPVSRELFGKFLGFWLAEGRKYHTGTHKGWGVKITQTKPEGIEWFDGLLREMDWDHSRKETKKEVIWTIKSKGLRTYLQELCFGTHELKIPDEVFTEWTEQEMRALLEGLSWGDGTYSATQQRFTQYTSTSYRLVSDVQRLMAHVGMSGQVRRVREAATVISSFEKKYVAHYDQWIVHYDTTSHAVIKTPLIKKINYDGMVYCLTVPNGTLFTRRAGVAMWSGNCVMEVSYRLLHHQLDQHEKALMGKMKMAKGLPHGSIDPLNHPALSPDFLSTLLPARSRGFTTGGPGAGRQRLESLRQRIIDQRRTRGVSGFKPRRRSW